MSFINKRDKEINCKIAYVGPAFSGKTTSLRHIYEETAPGHRGKITTLSGADDKTLFFDFLPLTLGKVKDYSVRLHLYTVPGQVIYDSSRTIILKGVDGVVFVLDSQIEKLEDNLESWKNLDKSLKNAGIDLKTLPVALQYNKRDLGNRMPVEEFRQLFNQRDLPEFETVATQGRNVMACFQSIAKKVLQELK
ncbi:MAG TPA: gliding-motility protein MglA [bacterium]|nr:gliding-motility protein MglA [bacterium]